MHGMQLTRWMHRIIIMLFEKFVKSQVCILSEATLTPHASAGENLYQLIRASSVAIAPSE